MLRDITVGQYYPTKSFVHNLDPRAKFVITFLYLISLFVFDSFASYAVVTCYLAFIIYKSNVPLKYIVKGLKPILFLLIFTAVLNIFWTPGIPIFTWKFISITREGLRSGVFMVFRLTYLIVGTSMLTYTTSPNELTSAIESLFSPLAKIKVPVHDFAMMMSLALRFIPILMEEANRIINAQSARGADFNEGNIFKRLKSMVSILVPLLVSATRRAYDLANAMEARCYNGGDGRTKMKPLVYHLRDRLAYVAGLMYLAAVILVNHFIML